MKNTMKKLGALLLALVMVLSLGVTAFAEAETEPAGEEDLSALARIGEETDTCRMVKITNLTGTDIMGLNIRKSGEWEFSGELLAEGDNFEKEEVSLFCYEPETADEATATDAEAEEETEAEPVLYDIQIVWTDWTVGVLYNVELDDMDEAELQRSWNSLPYIVYKSLESGEEVNTEEAETAAYLADPANSQSSGGSSSGGSSGGGSSSSGGSYGGDSGCIDNGLLW